MAVVDRHIQVYQPALREQDQWTQAQFFKVVVMRLVEMAVSACRVLRLASCSGRALTGVAEVLRAIKGMGQPVGALSLSSLGPGL